MRARAVSFHVFKLRSHNVKGEWRHGERGLCSAGPEAGEVEDEPTKWQQAAGAVGFEIDGQLLRRLRLRRYPLKDARKT
jgi:hypothetical protein